MTITRIKATENIISFFKALRISRGINSTVLAEQIGKAKSYISIMENGGLEYIKMRDFSNLLSTLLPTLKIELSNENLSMLAMLIDANDGDIDKVCLAMSKVGDEIKGILGHGLKHELDKQCHEKKINYNDLEKECKLPNGILTQIINSEIGDANLVYSSLKSAFLKLDFVIENLIDTYLKKIGVEVPANASIVTVPDANSCFKAIKNVPYPFNLISKTGGGYLDFCEDLHSNFPENRKQELYSKVDRCADVLRGIISKIDVDNYDKTIGYEQNLETVINLLLTTDGMRIFEFLFAYPLHKLDPKGLKEVLNFIDSKLEYQYIVQRDSPSEDQSSLDEYAHLECTFKESVWGELQKLNEELL